jgi:DNA-binding GntR family transcriptional regulator
MTSLDTLRPADIPVSSDTLGQLVAGMERMILSGELPPGARLREQALADTLGVRRGPLREAIRILEGRRLLDRTPNAGVTVIAPTLEDFEQLLVTREALEGMAARLAAQNMTSDQLDVLRQMAALVEANDDAGAALGVYDAGPDRDFHRHIAVCSRNRRIEQLLCVDLYSLLRLLRSRAARARPDKAVTHVEHAAVIDAIHRRDAPAAEEAMRAHIRRSRQTLLQQLMQQR